MTFPPNYPSEPDNNANNGGAPQNPYAAPGADGSVPPQPQQPPVFNSPPGSYGAQTPGAYPGGYPGGAPGYPGAAPVYADPYGQSTVKNSLGVWALVLGILAFAGCSIFTAIPAVIVGNKGKQAADQGLANNRGMSQAGVILGWVGIVIGVLGIAAAIIIPVISNSVNSSYS